MPLRRCGSDRDPTPTNRFTDTACVAGMGSVTMRSPLGSVVICQDCSKSRSLHRSRRYCTDPAGSRKRRHLIGVRLDHLIFPSREHRRLHPPQTAAAAKARLVEPRRAWSGCPRGRPRRGWRESGLPALARRVSGKVCAGSNPLAMVGAQVAPAEPAVFNRDGNGAGVPAGGHAADPPARMRQAKQLRPALPVPRPFARQPQRTLAG